MRSILIARTLLRRRLRRALDRPKRTLLTVTIFLLPLFSLVLPAGVGGSGATLDGAAVAVDGESFGLVALFESAFSLFWGLIFLGSVFGVDDRVADVDGGDFLVRAGGVRSTVLGRELAGHARRLVLFGIWFVAGAVVVAAGGGGVAALPVGAIGFLLLLLSASTAGRAVGLFARRWLLDRGYDVGRAKMGAASVLLGGALLIGGRAGMLVDIARQFPTAWFADWLLFEIVDTVRPSRLLGSLVFGSTVTIGGFLAHERLAADVWFRDPGQQHERESARGSGLIRGVARRVADGPTAALAWSVTLRRLRNPTYVAGVMLLGLLFWHDLTAGIRPAIRPVAATAYLAVAVPGAVALNPLADEGPVLTMLMQSGLSGRGFVAGYALAAAGLAGLLAAAAILVLVALDGGGVAAAVAVAGTPVLAFEAAFLAVAAGTVVPNADAHAVVASEGVTLPNAYAVAAYLSAVAAVLTPLVVGALVVGTDVALLAGAVGSVLLGGVGAAIAVRIVAPRFETFVLD